MMEESTVEAGRRSGGSPMVVEGYKAETPEPEVTMEEAEDGVGKEGEGDRRRWGVPRSKLPKEELHARN